MKRLFIFLTLLISVNVFSNLEEPLIIDVRSQAEWNQGHLERAERINWDEISNKISNIAPDKNKKNYSLKDSIGKYIESFKE